VKLYLVVEGAYETQSELGIFSNVEAALATAEASDVLYGVTVTCWTLNDPSSQQIVCWRDGRDKPFKWENGWIDPRAVGPEG
jgi:hypothetical protein